MPGRRMQMRTCPIAAILQVSNRPIPHLRNDALVFSWRIERIRYPLSVRLPYYPIPQIHICPNPYLRFCMIITFASSKGGVGKSTTCAAIASALALEGARVLLIDLDQNRTLDRWARKAPIDGLTVSAVEPQKFGAFFRDQEASGAVRPYLHRPAGQPRGHALQGAGALGSRRHSRPGVRARSARGARRGERHPRRG